MSDVTFSPEQIYRFIVDEIDSVPQLEALLLIWNHRPKDWSRDDIAKALYVSPGQAQGILKHLAQHHLIAEVEESGGRYALRTESKETENLLKSLDAIYRRQLVRVSTMIHMKASRAVLDFASAFQFKKD